MRRSLVLLAGAVAIAGGAALIGGDDSRPSASISGAPLDPQARSTPGAPTRAPASEVAAFEALADNPTTPATTVHKPDANAGAGAGAALIDQIDLDHVTRVEDHYEVLLRNGKRAILTLDPDLQPLAEKLLDESRAPRGAIVAMAPDGRILALAGRRTEEPKGSRQGTFDWRLATDVWAPAASVFKLVTASALVGAGMSPDDKVCFHGGIRSVLESNLHDDKHDSRCETLSYGVAHSNNAILGKLAFQKLEPSVLAATAKTLGIAGALPGRDLVGTAGEITIPQARDLEFAKIAAGFTASSGGTQLSVAGGALLAATFADGGEQPVPRLIASIDGVAVPFAPRRRAISNETARAVARMMIATCDSGSASKSFGKGRGVRVAGKTGTLAKSQPFFMEHSWFVGYAPAEKPEIIVSVLLGNPESWHLRGHEAARRMIDRALRPANQREKDRTAAVSRDKRNQW